MSDEGTTSDGISPGEEDGGATPGRPEDEAGHPEPSEPVTGPEAAAQPEGNAMTPEQVITMLAGLPESQRKTAVSAFPGLSDEQRQGLLEGAKTFAESGVLPQIESVRPEDVAKIRGRMQEIIALADEGKIQEAHEAAAELGMPPEVFDAYRVTSKTIGEKEGLSNEDKKKIVDEWKVLGIPGTAEEVEAYISEMHPQLNPTDKQQLIEQLSSIEENPENTHLTEAPEAQEIPEMEAQAEDMLAQANQVVENRLTDTTNPPNQEELAKLNRYQKKLGGLQEMYLRLFAEGQAGRKIAQKGGKFLYWALLTAIFLVLFEMNLIYKASKHK